MICNFIIRVVYIGKHLAGEQTAFPASAQWNEASQPVKKCVKIFKRIAYGCRAEEYEANTYKKERGYRLQKRIEPRVVRQAYLV